MHKQCCDCEETFRMGILELAIAGLCRVKMTILHLLIFWMTILLIRWKNASVVISKSTCDFVHGMRFRDLDFVTCHGLNFSFKL